NQTEAGKKILRKRVVVEHRIARLVHLGCRQSRYFGRQKTCFQVVMAAVVANLTLVVAFCRRKLERPTTNDVVGLQAIRSILDASTKPNFVFLWPSRCLLARMRIGNAFSCLPQPKLA